MQKESGIKKKKEDLRNGGLMWSADIRMKAEIEREKKKEGVREVTGRINS